MYETKMIKAGTLARCRRYCREDAQPLPETVKAERISDTAYTLLDFARLPCGHTFTHQVLLSDNPTLQDDQYKLHVKHVLQAQQWARRMSLARECSRLARRVNSTGRSTDYPLLRQKEKELAELVVAMGKVGGIHVTRSLLRYLNKKDFPENTRIHVSHYIITVSGKKGLHTSAYNTGTGKILTEASMPQYIQWFVF